MAARNGPPEGDRYKRASWGLRAGGCVGSDGVFGVRRLDANDVGHLELGLDAHHFDSEFRRYGASRQSSCPLRFATYAVDASTTKSHSSGPFSTTL
jgi:hypothetical protein